MTQKIVVLIELGALLLVSHFLGDYFLQIALRKILKVFRIKYAKFSSWQILAHCSTYLLFFIPIFWFFEMSWFWLVFLFLAHWIVDSQTKKIKVKRSYKDLNYLKRLLKFDLGIILDQGLHFLCLLLILSVWIV